MNARYDRFLTPPYRMGWRKYWEAEQDPMFTSIRHHPRFAALVARMQADVAAIRERAGGEERAAGLRDSR